MTVAKTPSTVEVYQVLCEIRDLMKSQDATLAMLLGLTQERLRRATPGNGPAPASDADLDGPRGDPEVKAKDPRDWNGPPMKGRKFSECPPEYLDMIADRLDYFNTQLGQSDEDKKKRHYNTLDASRARGWAARKRTGYKPTASAQTPAVPAENPFGSDGDVSF